ncbi:hypothetical protein D9601_03455 [Sphingomonas sp. MA1305]|uniref:DUF6894 family protein n=1 Tax=Sphingomonas sp. MA1305 TaxID=2479204 RepID=UPI0018DF4777|nr:hypothetical protein [Sphingomonas sp. MA1305]MBI0474421.1 hypothetical protein [Sphingomonas sp. MA1305]
MPRFFFHTETDKRFTDMEGTEFPTFREARHDAIRLSGVLLKDAPESFWGSRPWSITVTDAVGLILWTLEIDGQTSPAGQALEKPRPSKSGEMS